MKRYIIIILLVVGTACSHDNVTSRHQFGQNDTEETGGNTNEWASDNTEKADTSLRIKSKDIEMAYGKPGILYSVNSTTGIVRIVDIDNNNEVEFTNGTRQLKLNGNVISQNMILFHSDDSGTQWYHGYHETDKSPVYFVWRNF